MINENSGSLVRNLSDQLKLIEFDGDEVNIDLMEFVDIPMLDDSMECLIPIELCETSTIQGMPENSSIIVDRREDININSIFGI